MVYYLFKLLALPELLLLLILILLPPPPLLVGKRRVWKQQFMSGKMKVKVLTTLYHFYFQGYSRYNPATSGKVLAR